MVETLYPPAPLKESEVLFVKQCVDVLISLTELYGFSSNKYQRKGTYNHWVYLAAASGDAMKLTKYKLAAFYSFWKAQELPESPFPDELDNPSVILGGRGYRFVRLLNRSNPRAFESYITSVLYSKKGMPRPGKWRLRLAEENAFTKLTTRPHYGSSINIIPWGDVSAFGKLDTVVSQETVKGQLRRTVNELFKGESYTDDNRVEPFFPSTSANYINTRSLGGAVATIMEDDELIGDLRTSEDLIDVSVIGNKHRAVIADSTKLRLRFLILYKRILRKSRAEPPVAVPLALAEALKTRVISKGPPLAYTALKPLQRKLWLVLKKHPVFKLIGQPVDPWYVQERMGAKLAVDEAYLSVDYSDATNEMFSWVSDEVVAALSDVLSLTEDERVVFKRILTGHLIEFEDEILPQERGQLMGSIVSFPILCIVNAACCRWAQELAYQRTWSLSDCRLGINGDDGILRTNGFGKLCWEKISSYCGLLPSVGKVYFSRTFLNINSTTYLYHSDGYLGDIATKRILHFELVQYVNLGLLFNLQRSGTGKAGVDDAREGTIGSRVRELIRLCPEDMQIKVIKKFLHLNKSVLGRLCVPWFIPEDLGGVGLPMVGSFVARDKDLRLARMIYDHPKEFKIPQKPRNTPWRVWEYAQKRFEVVPADVAMAHHGTESISGSRLRGLFCVEALFRNRDISTLYQEAEAKSIKRYWRQLSNVWKRACLSGLPFPEPFQLGNFPVVHRLDDVPYITEITKFQVSTPTQDALRGEERLRKDLGRLSLAAPIIRPRRVHPADQL